MQMIKLYNHSCPLWLVPMQSSSCYVQCPMIYQTLYLQKIRLRPQRSFIFLFDAYRISDSTCENYLTKMFCNVTVKFGICLMLSCWTQCASIRPLSGCMLGKWQAHTQSTPGIAFLKAVIFLKNRVAGYNIGPRALRLGKKLNWYLSLFWNPGSRGFVKSALFSKYMSNRGLEMKQIFFAVGPQDHSIIGYTRPIRPEAMNALPIPILGLYYL